MKKLEISIKQLILYIITIIVGVLLDQYTKVLVASHLKLYERNVIINNFFNLTYIRNQGAAWGIMQGKMNIFFVISIIAVFAIGYYFYNSKPYQLFTRYGLILIFTGLIGNLIDRIYLGYVRDFLDFIIINYDFPVFNVADICITVGVILIIFEIGLEEYKAWKLTKSK